MFLIQNTLNSMDQNKKKLEELSKGERRLCHTQHFEHA